MPAEQYSLNLFDTPKEQDGQSSSETFLRDNVKQVLKHLWKDWHIEEPKSVFSLAFIKGLWQKKRHLNAFYQAILVDRDPFFLKAARLEIQASLDLLTQQLLKHPPVDEPNKKKVTLALHNILNIYAMFCPTPEEIIRLPQYINEQWQSVSYNITAIELTPQKGFWLNLIDEEDRLFSYGLTPLDNENAHPLLLHCGTGWPTAQGINMQLLADIWPNKTPGEIFFEWSGERIKDWLYQHNNKTIITGQSLGGSLSYLTALHCPEKTETAYCLNPPGMFKDYDENHRLFGAWNKLDPTLRPPVHIQKQGFDFVSKCGTFKEDFRLSKINISGQGRQRMLAAHARSYISCDECHLEENCNIQEENTARRRKRNNFWLYTFGRFFGFYFFLAPTIILFRPIKRYIVKHSFEILVFSLVVALFCLCPPVGALLSLPFIPALGTVFLSSLLPSLIISQVVTAIINQGYDFLFNQQQNLKSYFHSLAEMDNLTRRGKLIYDGANILSLGLLNIVVKTIIGVFVEPIINLKRVRDKPCDIHTKTYNEKSNDLNQYPPPPFTSKLQVWSFIGLFYLVALPIKFFCYDIPKFILYDLPKKIFSCVNSSHEPKELATAPLTPTSRARQSSLSRCFHHYGPFFSCCIHPASSDSLDNENTSKLTNAGNT